MPPLRKGVSNVHEDAQYIYLKNKRKDKCIKISLFHISPKSDKFNGDDMMGIVLYEYNGKSQWTLNGIKCKSPYTYLCKSSSLSNKYKSYPVDTMHARCFKKLFGVDPDYTKIVGGGFAFKDNKWKFNSGTFCAPDKNADRNKQIAKHYKINKFKDDWHDKKREMHEIEQKYITKAVEYWRDSNCKKHVYIAKGAVTWSWWNGRWMDYDEDTNGAIENEYEKYLKQVYENEIKENDTYCIDLNTDYFQSKAELKNKYKIYFSSPNIKLDCKSIHSRNNTKWKYDKDRKNKYFVQENHVIKRYRIVRRRNCND